MATRQSSTANYELIHYGPRISTILAGGGGLTSVEVSSLASALDATADAAQTAAIQAAQAAIDMAQNDAIGALEIAQAAVDAAQDAAYQAADAALLAAFQAADVALDTNLRALVAGETAARTAADAALTAAIAAETTDRIAADAAHVAAVDPHPQYLLKTDQTDTFLKLTDTVASYAGLAGRMVAVNVAEDGLEALELVAAIVAYDDTVSQLPGTPTHAQAAIEAVTSLVKNLPAQVPYADVAAANADVGNQPDETIAHIADGSADPNVTAGWVKYQKIGGAWTYFLSQEDTNVIALTQNELDNAVNDITGTITSRQLHDLIGATAHTVATEYSVGDMVTSGGKVWTAVAASGPATAPVAPGTATGVWRDITDHDWVLATDGMQLEIGKRYYASGGISLTMPAAPDVNLGGIPGSWVEVRNISSIALGSEITLNHVDGMFDHASGTVGSFPWSVYPTESSVFTSVQNTPTLAQYWNPGAVLPSLVVPDFGTGRAFTIPNTTYNINFTAATVTDNVFSVPAKRFGSTKYVFTADAAGTIRFVQSGEIDLVNPGATGNPFRHGGVESAFWDYTFPGKGGYIRLHHSDGNWHPVVHLDDSLDARGVFHHTGTGPFEAVEYLHNVYPVGETINLPTSPSSNRAELSTEEEGGPVQVYRSNAAGDGWVNISNADQAAGLEQYVNGLTPVVPFGDPDAQEFVLTLPDPFDPVEESAQALGQAGQTIIVSAAPGTTTLPAITDTSSVVAAFNLDGTGPTTELQFLGPLSSRVAEAPLHMMGAPSPNPLPVDVANFADDTRKRITVDASATGATLVEPVALNITGAANVATRVDGVSAVAADPTAVEVTPGEVYELTVEAGVAILTTIQSSVASVEAPAMLTVHPDSGSGVTTQGTRVMVVNDQTWLAATFTPTASAELYQVQLPATGFNRVRGRMTAPPAPRTVQVIGAPDAAAYLVAPDGTFTVDADGTTGAVAGAAFTSRLVDGEIQFEFEFDHTWDVAPAFRLWANDIGDPASFVAGPQDIVVDYADVFAGGDTNALAVTATLSGSGSGATSSQWTSDVGSITIPASGLWALTAQITEAMSLGVVGDSASTGGFIQLLDTDGATVIESIDLGHPSFAYEADNRVNEGVPFVASFTPRVLAAGSYTVRFISPDPLNTGGARHPVSMSGKIDGLGFVGDVANATNAVSAITFNGGDSTNIIEGIAAQRAIITVPAGQQVDTITAPAGVTVTEDASQPDALFVQVDTGVGPADVAVTFAAATATMTWQVLGVYEPASPININNSAFTTGFDMSDPDTRVTFYWRDGTATGAAATAATILCKDITDLGNVNPAFFLWNYNGYAGVRINGPANLATGTIRVIDANRAMFITRVEYEILR